jgi:hypothetical protein
MKIARWLGIKARFAQTQELPHEFQPPSFESFKPA